MQIKRKNYKIKYFLKHVNIKNELAFSIWSCELEVMAQKLVKIFFANWMYPSLLTTKYIMGGGGNDASSQWSRPCESNEFGLLMTKSKSTWVQFCVNQLIVWFV